jgi:Zn-dependent protease with chaperone function
LAPRRAVQILTVTVVSCALAVVWALLLLVLGWVARFEWVAERLGWCHALRSHSHGSAVVGLAALAALGWCVVGAVRAGARHRAVRSRLPVGSGIEILPITEPIAHAVPGRPGHVVVSAGALDVLDELERTALLAHEQAHLACRHHRFVRIGDVAAGAVPPLRPMTRRLRFATERWADEDAASVVGDRQVVARAIIRIALARQQPEPAGTFAIAGVGVTERVEALLAGPPGSTVTTRITLLAASVAMLSATLASTVQLQHVLALAHHICPH